MNNEMNISEDSDYRQGLYTIVKKDRFDSESERKVCLILNRIMRDYEMDRILQLRLTPQQALDNYIEISEQNMFKKYLDNRVKWMKFDFIFEEVYEWKDRMHYIPVAVVEFDGPFHNNEEQKKRDRFKNGVVRNIGAGLVRIDYKSLNALNENELRNQYEEQILNAIIQGYFSKTVSFRKEEALINETNEKKYKRIIEIYNRALEGGRLNARIYHSKMLAILHYYKELGITSAN